MPKMREDVKAAWLERLADPEIQQVEERLKGPVYSEGPEPMRQIGVGYCCLGVLGCVLRDRFPDILEAENAVVVERPTRLDIILTEPDSQDGADYEGSDVEIPPRLWSRLFVDYPTDVTHADPSDENKASQLLVSNPNDNGESFAEISEIIRREW